MLSHFALIAIKFLLKVKVLLIKVLLNQKKTIWYSQSDCFTQTYLVITGLCDLTKCRWT